MCIWQRSFDVRRRCGKNWSGGIPLGVEANSHAPAGRGKGMEGSQVFDKLLTSWAIKYQIKLRIRGGAIEKSFIAFAIFGFGDTGRISEITPAMINPFSRANSARCPNRCLQDCQRMS